MLRVLSLFTALLLLPALGAAANPATLSLPDQIEIATINGVETRSFKRLLGGDQQLELAPGRYEILAYYHEIWPQGDGHDTLMSDPALFVLDAESGHRYTIGYPQPERYESARKLAADFQGWLLDTGTDQRTPSQASGLRFRRGLTGRDRTLVADTPVTPQPKIAPLPAARTSTPPAAPVTAPTAASAGTEWLPMMQAWWAQATAEERRAFLAWVATQR